MEDLRHGQLMQSVHDFHVNGGTPAMAFVVIFRLESYVNEMEERITELNSLPHQTRSIHNKVAKTTFYRNMAWAVLRKMRKRYRRWFLLWEEE